MARFLGLFSEYLLVASRIALFFTKILLKLTWRYRIAVCYGALMFCLGIWAASDSGRPRDGEISSFEETTEPEEEVSAAEPALIDKIRNIYSSEDPEVVSAGSSLPPVDNYSVDLVVGKGDTFLNMLIEAGASRQEAYSASNALDKTFNVKSLKLGQRINVLFEDHQDGSAPKLSQLKIEKSDSYITVKRDISGEFRTNEDEKRLVAQNVRAGGEITSNMFQLASDMGIPTSVIMEAIREFSYDVDFQRDIQSGNRFEVLYEIFNDEDGRKVKDGDLKYALLTVGGEKMEIYRFTPSGGEDGFYTAEGRAVKKALLRTPISGARVSSGFGFRRHPILGYSKMHKGVDFAAATGTPVYAAGDGVIDKIGRFGAYGKYVRIRHNGTYSTAYAHLNKYASGMKKGRRVKQGQIIAYVGSTGRSTGPHLHYETLVNGKQANPLKIKMNPGKKLTQTAMKKFEERKKEINSLIAGLPLEKQVASRE